MTGQTLPPPTVRRRLLRSRVSATSSGASHRLVGDAVALITSQGATAVLGLAFWAAAARGYPEAEVGRAAAVITSGVMLGTLSNLSLGAMYERFLSLAGHRAGHVIARGHALSAVISVVLATALIVWGPRDALFAAPWEVLAFPLLVIALAVFILQDQVAVGLHQARWAATKNISHSVAKLVLVVVLVGTSSATSIVAAWGVSALVCSVAVSAAVRRLLQRREERDDAPRLPARRALVSYFAASYGTTSIAIIAPLVIPLLVVDQLGPEANAHFAVTWALTIAFLGLLTVVIGPFVAAASADPARLRPLTQRIAVVMLGVGLGGGAFLAVAAPVLIALVGERYAAEGTPLLRLMAIALPLAVVGTLYTALARFHRRLRLTLLTQILSALVVVGGSWLLVEPYGLRGVGYAYIAAEALVAVVLVVPLARWLAEALRR